MTRPITLAEKVRRGEPVSPTIAVALSMATPLTRLGMWVRRHRPSHRVEARVISYGNLTVGGTGKTPAVIERALLELGRGETVGILTRGYGAQSSSNIVVSNDVLHEQRLCALGDEATLILEKAPGAVVFKGPNRAALAKRAVSDHGCTVLILDDGYQHLALERDENVLLIDATNPFGNRRLLPRGILREPVEAMKRATAIVLTRCDQADGSDALINEIRRRCPSTPIRRTLHAASAIIRVSDGQKRSLDELRGRDVDALCALGRPESFFRTLESLGARLHRREVFEDHAVIPPSAFVSDHMIIVTEKDAIKITGNAVGPNVYALEIELKDLP